MKTHRSIVPLLALMGFFSSSASAALPPAYDFQILFTDFRGTPTPTEINEDGWVSGNIIYDSYPVLWKDGSLNSLSPGSQVEGTAWDVNNHGQVAGSLSTIGASPAWQYHDAVVWNNGTPTRLDHLPNGESAQALGINDVGKVGGWSKIAGGPIVVPTVWNGTTPTQLPTPFEGQYSAQGEARDLNNKGQIVGWGGPGQALLWEEGNVVALDPGNIYGSRANAINEAGEIVGYRGLFNDEVTQYAAYWKDGNFIDLGVLTEADYSSEAFDINNQGIIVGASHMSGEHGDNPRAVIWDGGQIYDLNSFLADSVLEAGWQLLGATAINDKGQIVGYVYNRGIDHSGSVFLLTPVPEPETYAMMLAGLGVIGIAARRRKPSSVVRSISKLAGERGAS
jgi:probable HAF family extracellular repeat protein